MGRPRKDALATEGPGILTRLRIHQDYRQYIVIMDVADVIPFAAFRSVDTLFPKMGLIIKRQFGFLGFTWGYGAIKERRDGDSPPTLEAPVSLHIYFQMQINEDFLKESAEGFSKILNYIRREWAIYKGDIEEEY
jgi:hypothetical protein